MSGTYRTAHRIVLLLTICSTLLPTAAFLGAASASAPPPSTRVLTAGPATTCGAPSISLGTPSVSGRTVSINGVTLPGSGGCTIVSIKWTWGDSKSSTSWFPASHKYASPGTYAVVATSHQSDGQTARAQVNVSVSGAAPRIVTVSFPGTFYVQGLAAEGRKVLTCVVLSNGTEQLDLTQLPGGSTSAVETFPASVVEVAMVGAGGRFYVALDNYTYGTQYYQEISTSGAVRGAPLSLGTTPSWSLIYGNSTAVVAASLDELVVLDPSTGAVVANYSTWLPAGVGPESILPMGASIYLAGSIERSGASSAYFGVLNLTTHAVSRLAPLRYYSAPYGATYLAVGAGTDGQIYVGGGEEYYNGSNATGTGLFFSSIQGLLGRYAPSSGTWTDLDRSLPAANASVGGISPWGKTVVLNEESVAFYGTGPTYLRSWFEEARVKGNALVDHTSWFPGFVCELADETGSGGGYVSMGGYGSSGLGEIVAVAG